MSGPGGLSPNLEVGTAVVLQTPLGLGEDVCGEVFAHDKSTDCLLIKQPGAAPYLSNLVLLKASTVKLESSTPPAKAPDRKLPFVDMQKCRAREEKAVAAAQRDAAKIGVGVTREAQQIFDALAKTMPTVWEGKNIVVLDEVVIVHPYGPDNCMARHETLQPGPYERVRKVLEAERRRLGHD